MCHYHYYFSHNQTTFWTKHDCKRKFAGHISSVNIGVAHFHNLMRFRTSCWPIEVNHGRRNRIAREDRGCKYCAQFQHVFPGHGGSASPVEDESHVFFQNTRNNSERMIFLKLFISKNLNECMI